MQFRWLIASAVLLTGSHAGAAEVSLRDALAQGAQSSPRIAQARAQAEAAEARARQAGVSPNPEISLEVENFAGTGPYRNVRSAETTLALSQRLELGGKRGARMAVAGAERDAALLAYKRAEADLARDIRIAYAELRAAEDRAVLARDNVAQAEELARSAGLYVEVGRDPPLRKLRADALLAEAKAEQARTFGELLTARRALADLIGSSDSELSSAGFDDGVTPPLLPPATPTLDEQVAAAERDAARARIRVAQADAVPDLTASAGVRRISDGRETAFVAGIALPLPIRDRNRGNIAAAGSDSLAAEAALAQVRLDANRAQHDARMLLGAANERVAALSGPGLAQAEEALRLARIGYAAGKFSLIELIDAQSALNAAREALISARLDRARALAALNRATAQ
ncbi:TolC family protein [Novosphingobium olei]|jgi:cobalt-zinc-cadmium efflux system outer membrane protein|uniref:TolC family protein n=1 Tax=Novosphingobium olei TaxID=2728851 RepID=A0A7Y0GAP7_9SPHN|nr:TolC family protein [Novosphingobium olei]NML94313.1 TolC family protein [Novosphingobium olei]